MVKLSSLLLILLLWLQYSLWFGKNGVCDLIYVSSAIKLYESVNDIVQMRTRNSILSHEINDLMYGYEAIEEISRCDLGMIQLDEMFYRVE